MLCPTRGNILSVNLIGHVIKYGPEKTSSVKQNMMGSPSLLCDSVHGLSQTTG